VDLEEIFYQAICRETREEIELYIMSIYFIIDKKFNYDLYIIDIGERISLWLKLIKNRP